MTERKKGLLLVMLEVEPEAVPEFNEWYDKEHFPERMACPGFLSGARYLASDGSSNYLAIYELESVDVLSSPGYQEIAGPSEWTARMLPHFTKRVRNVYEEITK